jgi:hypothetical protein
MHYGEEAIEDSALNVSVSVVGAGAAPPTIPTSHSHLVASTGRTGVGLYTIQLKPNRVWPTLLGLNDPAVIGPSGKWGSVISYVPTTGLFTIQTFAANGAAVELVAADQLFVNFRVRNSKVKYGGAA